MHYNLINRELCYSGFFKLSKLRFTHSLFAGGECEPIEREIVEKGQAAAILLYDPTQRKIAMTEQFRVGALQDEHSAWITELVAGYVEPGEQPADVVVREAQEEAGCSFDRIESISSYYLSPGSTSEKIHLYCGRVNINGIGGIHGLAEEGEDIRIRVLDCEEAFVLLDQGFFNSATPIIALQWLKLHEQDLLTRWRAKNAL